MHSLILFGKSISVLLYIGTISVLDPTYKHNLQVFSIFPLYIFNKVLFYTTVCKDSSTSVLFLLFHFINPSSIVLIEDICVHA